MSFRVVVGTDGSASAERAVQWGGAMARNFGAELVLVRVVPPVQADGGTAALGEHLARQAAEVGDGRGRGITLIEDDAAAALVRIAAQQHADVLVVGNAGMAGRRQFLLGNVPNRVSHQARCTVAIVNTTEDGCDATVPAARIPRPLPGAPTGALVPRALHIARVLRRVGLPEVLSGQGDDDEQRVRRRAHALRCALEELGPTFCKVGQVLSTRPDLLAPAYIEELSTLQDRVAPMREAEVVAVMEAELRVPWEDVFETIDPTPLAAGTIAQVHRATLSSGDRVVVKVQRPSARAEIDRDLELFRRFTAVAQRRAAIRRVADVGAVHAELAASLHRELDFRQEAANLRRLRDAVRNHPHLGVPQVHDWLCTERLLVMEEIAGVPVREATPGPARIEAARELTASFYEQVLSHGFFHADPHPGNLLWWNERLYFLDGGMTGEVPAEVRETLLLLLVAMWQEDSAFLTDVVLLLAGEEVPPDLDVEAFRERLGAMLARWRRLPLERVQVGTILQEMSALAMEYGVPLPASLILVAKALAQAQLSAAVLDPHLDPFAVAGGFLGRTALRRAGTLASPQHLVYEAEKLRVRSARILEALERITGVRPGHPLQVRFHGTGGLEARVRAAGRRIALSLLAVGIFATLTIASTAANRPPAWVLGLLAGVATIVSVALLTTLLLPEGDEVPGRETG